MIKRVIQGVLWIIILAIFIVVYLFFTNFSSYKWRSHFEKWNKEYATNIDYNKLRTYEDYFEWIEKLKYNYNDNAKYKIYDGPIISNKFDRAHSLIEKGTQKTTQNVEIIKKTKGNFADLINKIRNK